MFYLISKVSVDNMRIKMFILSLKFIFAFVNLMLALSTIVYKILLFLVVKKVSKHFENDSLIWPCHDDTTTRLTHFPTFQGYNKK